MQSKEKKYEPRYRKEQAERKLVEPFDQDKLLQKYDKKYQHKYNFKDFPQKIEKQAEPSIMPVSTKSYQSILRDKHDPKFKDSILSKYERKPDPPSQKQNLLQTNQRINKIEKFKQDERKDKIPSVLQKYQKYEKKDVPRERQYRDRDVKERERQKPLNLKLNYPTIRQKNQFEQIATPILSRSIELEASLEKFRNQSKELKIKDPERSTRKRQIINRIRQINQRLNSKQQGDQPSYQKSGYLSNEVMSLRQKLQEKEQRIQQLQETVERMRGRERDQQKEIERLQKVGRDFKRLFEQMLQEQLY